jgi:hypothetical protein
MSAFQKVEFDQGALRIIDDQGDDDNDVAKKPALFSDIAKRNASSSSSSTTSSISSIAYVTTSGGGGDAVQSRAGQYATRCRLFAAGKCTFGARCHFRHDGVSAAGADEASSGGAQSADDQECGICMEMVSAKGERFGLLLGCVHAFCLPCIREWRANAQQQRAREDADAGQHASTEAARSCPVCRLFSPYVIPSVYFVTDTDRKLELQDEFLLNTKRTRCRYWSGKPGSCQFGSSCFYQHINPDGTPGIDATRSYVDADGIHVIPATDRHSLADFIVTSSKAAVAATSSAQPVQQSEEHLPKWARGLDENEIAEVRKTLQANNNSDNNGAASSTNNAPSRRPVTADIQSVTRGFAELDLSGKRPDNKPAVVAAAAAAASTIGVGDWSDVEQSKLEAALKLFPGEAGDKQRWQTIADFVGRSRKDCVMRVRFCASLQSQQQKQQTE